MFASYNDFVSELILVDLDAKIANYSRRDNKVSSRGSASLFQLDRKIKYNRREEKSAAKFLGVQLGKCFHSSVLKLSTSVFIYK